MTSERADQEGRDDMTAVLLEEDRRLLDMVRTIHDDLNLPDGYRAEIIGGQIAVSPSPFGKHAGIIRRIDRAITNVLPPDLEVYHGITLEEGRDRYIPDLGVWPIKVIDTDTQWRFPANKCLLAVEVTSPRQEARDRNKTEGYARGGVPIYLIVDRSRRECMVNSDPVASEYDITTVYKFGEAVTLSFPSGWEVVIDTSDF